MPEAVYGRSSCWLTCVRIDLSRFGVGREGVRLYLESCDIEARPVWKPLHLQQAFSGCTVRGGEVAAGLFDEGLCLPSGSNLSDTDQDRVITAVAASCEAACVRRRRVG